MEPVQDMDVIDQSVDARYPPGLVLYKGLLRNIADEMYTYFDELPWNDTLSRRTQHYGYSYDYTLREPKKSKLKQLPMPKPIKCMCDVLHNRNILKDYPNQVIINQYTPGQGISAHRDHYPIFGDSVCTMSFGSGVSMHFKPYKIFSNQLGDTELEIYLEPGDVLVFEGDARMKYSHEIKGRKSDAVNGKRISRGVRISATFRHVNEPYRG